MRVGLAVGIVLLAGSAGSAAEQARQPGAGHPGRALYDYFCYQCHGYSGDAKTLASTFLIPPPRDFTRADPANLSRAAMIEAVTYGKPGTAMSSFKRVLSAEQLDQVVDFVRLTFMAGPAQDRRYHTTENGWPEHARYAAAFPFASGDIPLDTSWDALTPAQRQGKRLYLEACVSCHDHVSASANQPVWSPRAVSYPRQYYVYHDAEHDAGQHEDGDYPELAFELHERAPDLPDLNAQERRGEQVYQANCAFCHAEDGTGLNWIGSFLEPHPPDLNQRLVAISDAELKQAIEDGIAGTSMPAWRGVLSAADSMAVIEYMRRAFTGSAATESDSALAANRTPPHLQWRRLEK